jgi:hypothetical protein
MKTRLMMLAAIAMVPVALYAAGVTAISVGSSLPGSCVNGNLYLKTGSSKGLYWCDAGSWTGPLITSAGSGTVTNTGTLTSGKVLVGNGSADLKVGTAGSNSILLGSGASGSGSAYSELTLGTNLSMSGTTLNASGGGGGGLVLLEEHTASSSATLDFTTRNVTGQSGNTFQSDFDVYQIEFVNLVFATDLAQLQCQVSSDSGSTWVSTGNYYAAIGAVENGGGSFFSSLADPQSEWILTGSVADNWTVNGFLKFYNPLSTANFKMMTGILTYADHVNIYAGTILAAINLSATGYNALRFDANSGNITSGTIRIYGLAK